MHFGTGFQASETYMNWRFGDVILGGQHKRTVNFKAESQKSPISDNILFWLT